MTIESRMRQLEQEIERHNKLYYVNANPEISDREYDALLRELEDLEKEHPDLKSPTSPTQRVGGEPLAGFNSVAHAVRMMSLANTYRKEELAEFDIRINKLASGSPLNYVLEPKIDGVAISLRYENGILRQALTRGDGLIGDDVTQNVKTIKSIPLKINTLISIPILEVRGEIYMDTKGFAKLNHQRQESGLDVFANPRNACAGSLKLLDSKEVAKRPLDAIIYATGETKGIEFETHSELLNELKKIGFKTADRYWLCETITDVYKNLDELDAIRSEFSFETDGGVIKVNQRNLYERLGYTAKSPRWAVAYKYEPEQAETRLVNISIQVGRTGVLTPVADLEPVLVSGSTVRRATLHNEEEIARKDVRIGDNVIIEKAGEIIPAVVKVLKNKRDGTQQMFTMPSHCPECDQVVSKKDNEVAIRCTNIQCPAQLKTWLDHFASKNALDIEGLGGIVSEKLVESDIVKSPMDLFKLKIEDLKNFNLGTENSPRMLGEKNATRIINSVQKSKTKPLAKWIFALGIPKLGVVGSRLLAEQHSSLQDLANSKILQNVVQLHENMKLASETRPSTDKDKTESRVTEYSKYCDFVEHTGKELTQIGWYEKRYKPEVPEYTKIEPAIIPKPLELTSRYAELKKEGTSLSTTINQTKNKERREALQERHSKILDEMREVITKLSDLGWCKEKFKRNLPIYAITNNEGIGLEAAKSILSFFKSPKGQSLLKQIEKFGIEPSSIEAIQTSAILGKTFVITGTLPTMKRPEAAELIRVHGGKVSSSISKNTDYLLAGEKAGSKLKKAESVGVKIIDEEELLLILDSQNPNAEDTTDSKPHDSQNQLTLI